VEYIFVGDNSIKKMSVFFGEKQHGPGGNSRAPLGLYRIRGAGKLEGTGARSTAGRQDKINRNKPVDVMSVIVKTI